MELVVTSAAGVGTVALAPTAPVEVVLVVVETDVLEVDVATGAASTSKTEERATASRTERTLMNIATLVEVEGLKKKKGRL